MALNPLKCAVFKRVGNRRGEIKSTKQYLRLFKFSAKFTRIYKNDISCGNKIRDISFRKDFLKEFYKLIKAKTKRTKYNLEDFNRSFLVSIK